MNCYPYMRSTPIFCFLQIMLSSLKVINLHDIIMSVKVWKLLLQSIFPRSTLVPPQGQLVPHPRGGRVRGWHYFHPFFPPRVNHPACTSDWLQWRQFTPAVSPLEQVGGRKGSNISSVLSLRLWGSLSSVDTQIVRFIIKCFHSDCEFHYPVLSLR